MALRNERGLTKFAASCKLKQDPKKFGSQTNASFRRPPRIGLSFLRTSRHLWYLASPMPRVAPVMRATALAIKKQKGSGERKSRASALAMDLACQYLPHRNKDPLPRRQTFGPKRISRGTARWKPG